MTHCAAPKMFRRQPYGKQVRPGLEVLVPINVIRVRERTVVCQGCWSAPAVNEVTVGAASPYHIDYCQPCTNNMINTASYLQNQGDYPKLTRFLAGT